MIFAGFRDGASNPFQPANAMPEERLLAQGAEVAPNTPEELGALMRSEIAKWGKLVKAAGIRID